jgi:hypothetical protein
VLVTVAITLHAGPVRAQAEDPAGGRALFAEARGLMEARRYDAACPKLEAARKLYRGAGIVLNLGDCYEHLGRTASAWNAFGEAATMAAEHADREEEAEAKRRQAALERRLSRLSIVVGHEVPGLVIQRDGVSLDRGAWASPLPVDPGAHTFSATAPGRANWQSTVTLTEAGKTITVEVPELRALSTSNADTQSKPPDALPSEPVVPPPDRAGAPHAHSFWNGQRIVGAGLATAGVIAAGVGGALALSSKSLFDTATTESGTKQRDDSSSAVSRGDLATVVSAVGGGLVVAGVIVWLTAPSAANESATSVATLVVTDGRQLLLRGRF